MRTRDDMYADELANTSGRRSTGIGSRFYRGDIAANNREDSAATVGTAGEDRLGVGDRDFVDDSMEAGMAEIELGRLASQKSDPLIDQAIGQLATKLQ